MRFEPEYDAIVVGSGANGGVAAKQLCEAGLKTLVLEAGPSLAGPSAYGSPVLNLAKQLKQLWFSHRQDVQMRHGGYWETNPDLYADDVDNPYVTPEGKPYAWIRGRQVGGRSHTWGGVLLRFSDYEFKAASRDGWGVDWPLSTAELSPYYAQLERFFQAWGHHDGLKQLPDGDFVGARPFSPGELVFKKAVEAKFDRQVIVSRGIRAGRFAVEGERFSRLSSSGSTLLAAERTGNLRVQSDAVVTRVLTDASSGKATGVEYLDARTRVRHQVTGRLVFLCASTIETLRIMMSSKATRHPDGLGAASGLLGKGLMDHIVVNTYFRLPQVKAVEGYQLLGSDGAMVPRYQNLGPQKAAHLRGFGLWGGISRLHYPWLLRRQRAISSGFFAAMGETLPSDDNQMRLHETVTDAWGLPAPFISCQWTSNDLQLAKVMADDTREMIEAAGGVISDLTDMMRTPMTTGFMRKMGREWTRTVPGLFVHEVGGARMGLDPKTSVTNSYGQVWEARNVFVTDGACWVSSGWQNPTHTEMAITWRACEHAVDELKRFNL